MGVQQVVGAPREELVMAIVSFTATPRAEVGKGAARQLRSKGEIPAVIYGHGREPQSLSLNARDLDKMLGHIQAESTVIEVTVGGATSKTLIREIQRHPIRRQILHVSREFPRASGLAAEFSIRLSVKSRSKSIRPAFLITSSSTSPTW
jgi:ribosomal protein bL25 (Ctc-form)